MHPQFWRLLATFVLCLAMSACCDLAITTAELPDGKFGEAYRIEFAADCDDDRWELISGELPPGLTLNQTGELIGVPTLAGVYTLTVGVSGQGDTQDFVSKGFSLAIVQPVGSLLITTSSTGSQVDPNGYTVTVGSNQFLIGVNEALTVPDVPIGSVTVALGELASGCSITSSNPVIATITEAVVTSVGFDITCGP